MNVYTCSDIDGIWMEGIAVVVALDADHARVLLNAKLEQLGMPKPRGDETLVQVDTGTPGATVLFNGDY